MASKSLDQINLKKLDNVRGNHGKRDFPLRMNLNSARSLASFGTDLVRSSVTKSIVAAAVAPIVEYTWKDAFAKALGYCMGIGAMALYSPMIIKLLKDKSADGMSAQTWMFNLFGMTLAILYPFKKGFPVSTYIELLATTAQSFGILGLIMSFSGKRTEYFYGAAGAVAAATFLFTTNIPPKILSIIQIVSIISCNYALVPQIMLSFKMKKAGWSAITASLSAAGCFVRILTTLQLTKDPLVLLGYMIGLTNNAIVLGQIYLYRNN